MVNEKLSLDDASGKVEASTYKSLIRSLLYLTTIKPDIILVASLLSKFMPYPSQAHYHATKRVLRYIRGSTGYGI